MKDRLNAKFRVIPDNIDTVTTVYNCKNSFISHKNLDVDFVRIDVLDESIEEINSII